MTTLQIQNLLSYLHLEYPTSGFDPGPLDGLTGPKTEKAIKSFQTAFGGLAVTGLANNDTAKALKHAVAYGMEIKLSPDTDSTGTFWDDITYFTREEFKCRCGQYHAPYCDGFPAEPNETLVRLVNRGREHFGVPAIPTSGLRCPQHNKDSGGVHNSKHMAGKALDFWLQGVSGSAAIAWFQAQPETDYTYIIEGNTIHVEVN